MNSHAFDHRKSYTKLRVTGADRAPLANKRIRIEQRRHSFLFGIGAFDTVELAGGAADGSHAPVSGQRAAQLADLLDKVCALCNYATLPFYWGRYEPVPGKPDEARTIAASRWLADRGITVKGHPLCWHTVCAPWLMRYSDKEILRRQLARIDREVSAFKGLIDTWDVLNEGVIMPAFNKYDNAVTRICKMLGRVGLIKEVFTTARKANPQATLILNDFDVSEKYEILIDGCLQAGVPIDVIGIQSHQHQGYWGKEKLLETLDRYSHFGLPIHFTENTIISGDPMPPHIEDLNDWQVDSWPSTPDGEERQAREVVEMYEILFAHPRVEAITTWDSTDGRWLNAPSGLLHKDNTPKPVYNALLSKIKGEWLTTAEITTNAHGEAELFGFRGCYTAGFGTQTASFDVDGRLETPVTFG
ncbi:MAG: endo-1,4-beta-xylanase [Treponema sp.]|jgi:GH35 family endo-1,4-beta-xylanase|nr:endo-1,4-beta-xylanase [Treponema sp.]